MQVELNCDNAEVSRVVVSQRAVEFRNFTLWSAKDVIFWHPNPEDAKHHAAAPFRLLKAQPQIQASAEMLIRSALFWNLTLRRAKSQKRADLIEGAPFCH
jgi:hypothetical protein